MSLTRPLSRGIELCTRFIERSTFANELNLLKRMSWFDRLHSIQTEPSKFIILTSPPSIDEPSAYKHTITNQQSIPADANIREIFPRGGGSDRLGPGNNKQGGARRRSRTRLRRRRAKVIQTSARRDI